MGCRARRRTSGGSRLKLRETGFCSVSRRMPEPGARHRRQHVIVAVALELVFAIAEEGEVVVADPFEQRPRLGHLVGIERRRPLVEQRHGIPHAGTHGRPILDRSAHIREDVLQVGFELVELRPLRLAVDLDVQQRLRRAFVLPPEQVDEPAVTVAPDPDGRVEEPVNPPAAARQRHRDRVDDERHVVGDDLDDAVRRSPAVLLGCRGVRVHLDLAGRPSLEQVPVREGGAVQIQAVEILGSSIGVVRAHEGLDQAGLRVVEALVDVRDGFLEERGLELLRLDWHPVPSFRLVASMNDRRA